MSEWNTLGLALIGVCLEVALIAVLVGTRLGRRLCAKIVLYVQRSWDAIVDTVDAVFFKR